MPSKVKVETVRFNQLTGKATIKECELEIRDGFGGQCLQLTGGPTGYECFYLEGSSKLDLSSCYVNGLWWCAGTEGRWDALYMNGIVLREALAQLELEAWDGND